MVGSKLLPLSSPKLPQNASQMRNTALGMTMTFFQLSLYKLRTILGLIFEKC